MNTLHIVHFRTHSKLKEEIERAPRTPDFSEIDLFLIYSVQTPVGSGSISHRMASTITELKCYLFFILGADVINFDGHVVLPYRFRNKKMKTLKDVIALKFKTTESEGVLLHGEGQQGDYITLELKKAKLVFSLNLGMF